MNRLPKLILFAICILVFHPGLSYSETAAYFPNFGQNNVQRILLSDETNFTSVGVCNDPYGAVVTPNGSNLLITCEADNELVIIPTDNFTNDGAQLPIDLGGGAGPRGVAVESQGRLAYVANYAGDTVVEINISTQAIVRTFSEIDGPWGVAAIFDTGDDTPKAYVTNHESNNLTVIDNNGAEIIDISLNGPLGIAVTPDGKFLYVANNKGEEVVIIDTEDLTISKSLTVGDNPWGVAMADSGDFVFVTINGTDRVSVISTSSQSITDTFQVGDQPTGVAAPANGDFAYVVNQGDNNISKVTTTGTVTPLGQGELDGAFSLGAFVGGSPPERPTELTAVADETDITLTWVDNADDTKGFKVERRRDEDENFVQIAQLSNTDTTYSDFGLQRDTIYHYRIRVFNDVADSEYSDEANTTTTGDRFSWCFIQTLLN